jgi:NADH:ubiquinone oxidoreductase subunit E
MSVFSAALTKSIEGYLGRYETKRSAILPILHAIQDEQGWVKPEHIDELEAKHGLSRVHVKEVITFYDIYKDEPVRKYQIRFCNSIACCMMGSKAAIHRIEEHIAKYEAEMGDDAPFSCEPFPCLGKCDGAPVMLVNKERIEKVTVDKVDEVLSRFAPLPK